MQKKILLAILMLFPFLPTTSAQPECFKEFSTGHFKPGDSVEAFYFIAVVYPNPDKKGTLTYLSPIFQIQARKTDTTWSRRGIGLFRYGVVEFKDSVKSLNPKFDATFNGDYKGIISRGFNPSRRVHMDAFCLNELRKYYHKIASKGKDDAVYMDDFEYNLSGYKDKDFDTLVIKKYDGNLSKPALLKKILKSKE